MRAVAFAYSNVGDRCLRVLRARGIEVPLVVTHRDHPGETVWFQRVADTAAELGLEHVYGDDPHAPELLEGVRRARPDVIFSFYYRRMLPPSILALAPQGAYNMHGSLLPKFRGRAPTNWAVLMGETETGATLHEMVAKPDAGAIVDRSAVPILPDDTAQQVFDKVVVAAEQVLWRSLPAIVEGCVPRLPNDVANGSYYGGRTPEDGRIDWTQPAARVYDLIRAVAPPYPGAFVEIGGQRLVVAAARRARDAQKTAGEATPAPGLHVLGERIVGICGDGGVIEIREMRAGSDILTPRALQALLSRAITGTST
jgi:methionyl-tRNA formyltransferase